MPTPLNRSDVERVGLELKRMVAGQRGKEGAQVCSLSRLRTERENDVTGTQNFKANCLFEKGKTKYQNME